MEVTKLQKLTIESIVQIFETDKLGGIAAYASISNMKGDTGGLTYGKHQTTINSGNLYILIKAYVEANGLYSAKFAEYLNGVKNKDKSLATNSVFLKLLKDSALNDPIMRSVQDTFFDSVYWNPAKAIADNLGATKALSLALVYDSTVHGSFSLIRNRVNSSYGTVAKIGELVWFKKYNETRRSWLANHSNALLHKTVYRQDTFNAIIAANNWDLNLPFSMRGFTLTPAAMGYDTEIPSATEVESIAEAVPEDKNDRILMLTSPVTSGKDVETLQNKLNVLGFSIGNADGIFGKKTKAAVEKYQASVGLKADGIVGNATKAKLGMLF